MTLNLTYHRAEGGGRMVEEGISPGVHQGKIVAVEADQKKKFQSEELEDCLRIDYGINGKKAHQKFTPSLHPKSKLFQLISALNPGAVSGGQLRTDEDTNAVIEKLVGRSCLVQIEVKVSGQGKEYLTVGTVLPVTSNGNVEVQDAKEVSAAQDDIPF